MAGAADWDERLARSFSGRLKQIGQERAHAVMELDGLPGIPVDDQGGTGGFAGQHSKAAPDEDGMFAVEVRWTAAMENGAAPPQVEMVAMVPARRYDARGLDAHYGMPDAFSVELIDADGRVVAMVASEHGAHRHPVRRGHPFVYRIDPPVAAVGVRVVAERLVPDADGGGEHVHAWAELFAFSGERNLAYEGAVRQVGGSPSPARWQWDPAFLVDGQTPLGLPEAPVPDHRNVGWLSNSKEDATDAVALAVDLGRVARLDGLRLLPARRPTSDLPSGFGFPRRLEVWTSRIDSPPRDDVKGWERVFARDFANPGHNPVWLGLDGVDARHVRLVAAELWREFDSYPAFFALSELEVVAGNENLALRRAVRSAEGMVNMIAPGGRVWSGLALSDGHGPDGLLVPTREWLAMLDARLALETRIHELDEETAKLISTWRGGALAVFGLCGLAGVVALVALPIRYRMRATRELLEVRERIAGDLHDEVGSNLGSIQMFADLAEGRSGPSEELSRIQRIAAETVSAVRDIVWLLRPGREHRIGTVEHLRETSSIMLESLKWKFSANEASWDLELLEDANRHLFLFFREALHNIIRHADATHVEIRTATDDEKLRLEIRDNGCGIPADKRDRPATLRALRQRTSALGAKLDVISRQGEGTTLVLDLPLSRKRVRRPAARNAP